jgi:threonyl-tRNA synthetase
MTYMYTKEQLFTEFKDVTKKDQSKKKETYTHRVAYLSALKEDMIKVPKNFSNLKITSQQLQNLINDWSAPNPRDAMYMRIFGMTFAEKKEAEELEYMNLNKAERDEKKKEREKEKLKEAKATIQ